MVDATLSSAVEGSLDRTVMSNVEWAAHERGLSVTAFLATAVQDAAEHALDQAHSLQLSDQDQQCLARLLVDPPEILTPR